MKTLKKMLAVFLVIIMLLSSAPLQGFVGLDLAEWFVEPFASFANAKELYSGECGVNLTWSLDSDGTLTIRGEGKMTNYIHPELMSSYSASEASVMALKPETATVEEEMIDSEFDFGLQIESDCAEITVDTLYSAAEADEEEFEVPTEAVPWYDYCDQIKRVVVEEGVTYIGSCAFMYCTNLESVVLADSVKEISYYAFAACLSLNSINLQMVEKIGFYAFMYAMEIETAVLENVETIDVGAFGYCVDIKSITFSDNLKSIGSDAFAGCVNITNIIIPERVEEIGDSAFAEMIALQNMENKSLTAVVTEGLSFIVTCSDIDSVEKCAFVMAEAYKYEMKSSLLGESADEEEMILLILESFNEKFGVSYSFEEFMGFIDSQDSSSRISEYFKLYCYEDSVEHEKCKTSGVTHILFGESEPHICFEFKGVSGEINWEIDINTRTLTFSGSGSIANYSTYSNKAPWIALSKFYDYVEFAEDSAVTRIGDAAFDQAKIKGISLPSTLVSIGSYAFRNCELESITIPANVSSIGYDAFTNNKKLETVSFEENSAITYFEGSLFTSCSSLKTVDIPAGVYSISNSTFSGCEALETLNIHPDNTNLSFADGILYNYDKTTIMLCLKSKSGDVVIPASVTNINDYAFDSCNLITSVSFEEDSKISYLYGFMCYCKALETVTLPKSLTSIYYSFNSCASLTAICVEEGSTSLYSENGVLYSADKTSLIRYPAGKSGEYEVLPETTTIYGSAFSYAGKLTKVVLPEGLTNIGSSAFYFCENLAEVVIPESVTQIGGYAFYYCSSLEEVIIPANVTRVEYDAFYGCSSLEEITFNNPDCVIGSSVVPKETTIKGYTISTAHDYAINYGNEFISIDGKVVESISIETLPNKTKYSVGSSFKTDGLSIKINFSDGTSIIKSDGLKVTGFNSVKPGMLTLTIDYAGHQATFDVEIYEINSEILLGETIEMKLDVGDTAYIKFVPTFSGDFPIEIGLSDYDNSYMYYHSLRTAICDESKNQIGGSTYVYPNTYAESVTYTLEKDRTYYFCIQYNYGGDGTSFDITLKCGHKTTTEYDEVPANCTNTGFTAGVFCEDCKQWISGHEVTDYKHTDENKDFICDLCNADAKKLLVSGNCGYDGDNIKWYLYDSGLLELIGTGKMQNYSGTSPWWNYTDSMYNSESIDIDIKKVTLSDGIINVGAYAFYSLSNVEEVILPDSIISFEYCAFYGCGSLSEITLPANLQSIGVNAFTYCSSLKEIVVPEGVTSIGTYAFSSCYNLISVSLPESLVSVSHGAFTSCDSLTCVFYAGTEENWNNILVEYDNDALINATRIYSSKPGEVIVVEEGDCNENIHWTVYSNGSLVLEGSGDMPYYNNSDTPWNKYKKFIRNVNISEGITSVGNQAFYYCINLKKVILSDTVVKIGENAFYGCTSLKEINLPATMESIGRYAFFDCIRLAEIVVPEGIVKLNDYTFSGCNALADITLPESLETIGAGVFTSCFALSEIHIPKNVSSIASGLFYDCESLQKITVDTKNDYYCDVDGVLFNKNKTTLMRFPENHSATTYTVPDGVTLIDTYAFSECYNLTEVVIPDSAQSAGSSAFYNCRNLNKVSVPASLDYDYDAFYNCRNISDIYISKGNGVMPFMEKSYDYTPWYASRNNYPSITLENGIANIGAYAFYYNTLSTISIPDTVTEIGECAFAYCHSIENFVIPSKIGKIGSAAFLNCSNLKNINVEEGNSSYASENGVLYNKDKTILICLPIKNPQSEFTIPDSVTTIGSSAFSRCTGLTSITIPDSVTTIGGSAFYGCTGLTSITIPDSVTTIGDDAFYGCTGFASVTIGDSVTAIGEYAFYYCTNLKEIKIYNPVCSIYASANTINKTATIYGYNNSTAKQYASTYSRYFVEIPCPHSEKYVTEHEEEPATCTEDGITYGKYCKCCKTWIEGHETIEATGHTFTEESMALIKGPTCIEVGIEVKCCSVCGAEGGEWVTGDSADYPETPHNYSGNMTYNYSYKFDGAKKLQLKFSSQTYTESNFDKIYIYDAAGNTYGPYSGSDLKSKKIELVGDNFSIKLTTDGIVEKYGFSFEYIKGYLVDDSLLREIEALGHEYDENWTIDEEATCEADGSKSRHCIRCNNYIDTEVIPALGHDYSEEFTVDKKENCTENGSKSRHCSRCDSKSDVTVIEATGHSYIDVVTAPTCTKDGYTTYTCSKCKYSYTDSIVAALGHDFSEEFTVDKKENCTTNGSKSRHCSRCDSKTDITVIEATGHNYSSTVVDPTCTADGYTKHTCSNCKDTYNDSTVAALGHDYSEEFTVDKKENCTENGSKSRHCSRCSSKTDVTVIEATGHSYSDAVTVPTCTKDGYTTHTCTKCKYAYTDSTVVALGHDYSEEFTVDKKENCTENGSKSRHCSRCSSKTDVTVIEAPGHSYNDILTEATCTTDGFTTHTCSKCKDTYKDSTVPALGHEYKADWTIDKEATCEADGSKSRHCTRCNKYTDTEVIPALGHDYSEEFTVDKKETCIVDGSKSRHCSRCDSKTDVTVIEAPGHNYSTVTVDVTCTSDGYTKYTCSRCKDTYRDNAIKSEGHKYNSVTVDPTCTKDGYTTHTCTVCNYGFSDSRTPAKGHSYGDWAVLKAATIFEEGLRERVCATCSCVEKEEIEKISIDINENENYGLVSFTVVNAQSLEPINGVSLFISTEKEGETTIFSDEEGKANVILPVGSVNVSAFADGLQVRNIKVDVKPGENVVPEIGLSSSDIYDAELTAKEMTLDEIEKAGIDVKDPENNNVEEYELRVKFDPKLDFDSIRFYYEDGELVDVIKPEPPEDDGMAELHYHIVGSGASHHRCKRIDVEKGTTVELDYTPNYPEDEYVFDGWYEDSKCTKKITHKTVNENVRVYGKLTYIGPDEPDPLPPDPIEVGGKKIYPASEKMFLIIDGEVSWLKEMFDVQLLVVNNSNTDSLGELKAELELPNGLSLAKMSVGEQSLSVEMDPISEGGFGTVNWYIKGDSEGSYNLSANLTGKVYPFQEQINEEFVLQNSISVLSGKALHLNFDLPSVVYYGEDFKVTATLTNVSGKTLYNVNHIIKGITQTSVYHEAGEDGKLIAKTFMAENGELHSAFARELKPGDKIVLEMEMPAKYVSRLMQEKIERYLKLVDAAEAGYKAIQATFDIAKLIFDIKGLAGSAKNLANIGLSGLNLSNAKMNLVTDIIETTTDIADFVDIEADCIGDSIVGSGLIAAGSVVSPILKTFSDPTEAVNWVLSSSVSDMTSALSDLNGYLNACQRAKKVRGFNYYDSLRTAISSIPIAFAFDEAIFETKYQSSSTSIPKTYTTYNVGPQYFGVSSVEKYNEALANAFGGKAYKDLAPGALQLLGKVKVDGSSIEDVYVDAVEYIIATEENINKVKVARQLNAENGTVRYRSWIETNESTTYSLRRSSTDDLFELSSSDNETAKFENGVLTFEGSATLEIVPKSTVGGILHIEGDDGTSVEVVIDVVEQHECNSDVFHSMIPPVDGEKGYGLKCCSICEEIIDIIELDADACGDNHDFGEWEIIVEAECDASEIKTRACEVCGYVDTVFGDATGHTEKTINVVEATCTEPGYSGDVVCDVCGDTISEGESITALGHEFDESSITKQPTCTESGEAKGKCKRCDEYSITVLDPIAHSYGSVVKAPSCTEKGYTTYTCNVCGDSYSDDYTDMLEHSYETIVTKPTCTEQGYTTYTCNVCGDSYSDDYTDMLEHSYETVVTKPTCAERGFTTYICTVCGTGYTSDFVEKTGHTGGKANCVELAVCESCGATYGEYSKDEHKSIVTDKAIAPTCTECGLTEGSHCDACDKVIVAQGEIDKLSHKYESIITEPSCTEKGFTTYTCINCDDSYMTDYTNTVDHDYNQSGVCMICGANRSDDCSCNCHKGGISGFFFKIGLFFQKIFKKNKTCKCGALHYGKPDAHNHNYMSETVVEATCTVSGEMKYTCSCGESYNEVVEQLGHDEFITEKTPATCTENGVNIFKCKRCEETRTEEVEATGHNEIVIPETASTCENSGLTEGKYCDACDLVIIKQEETPAKGHTSVIVPAVAPTCDDKGYTESEYCSVCDAVLKEKEELEALGHIMVADTDNSKEATCIEDGANVEKCSREDCVHTETEVIPATGHIDADGDQICDNCSIDMTDIQPDLPENPADNCDCNCHKGGITGFFFKFGLFFQKIFKKNKTCKCGISHY